MRIATIRCYRSRIMNYSLKTINSFSKSSLNQLIFLRIHWNYCFSKVRTAVPIIINIHYNEQIR